jgi:PAS domain S-box-containing protein
VSRRVSFAAAVALPALLTVLILTIPFWPRPYSYQFVAVIAVTAGIGGLGPGLVATALSATAIEVIWQAQPPVGLMMFVLAGVVLSYAGERVRRAERDRLALLSDLRTSAARAHANRAELEAVFQAMHEGVIVFDMNGRPTLVNDAQARAAGWTRREWTPTSLKELASLIELSEPGGRVLPVEEWPVSRVLQGESLRDCELRCVVLETGEESLFSYSGAPVRDERGRQVLAVIVTRDITERKRTEEALREANARLQEADRRKDEFLAVLAHELRNPLAPIRFALTLLRSPDSPQGRAREALERQVQHLVRLVDDLLDVSRITRNTVQLRCAPLNLQTLVSAAIEDIGPQASAAGHVVTVSNDEALPVDADATRIIQVLTNLLHNAVKFTPFGGAIAVSTERDEGYAVVRVRDSGVGIAPDALPQIFEMFHHTDSSLERAVGGLGIGLTLSRRLVEMHRGTLEARSEGFNQGAEFAVRLPLITDAAVLPRSDAPPARAQAEDSLPARLRVLIVEDNVDSAEMLTFLVSAYGHEPRVAHDGLAALRVFDEFGPDVVLLDIGLPRMNGYDVAREIRRRSARPVHLVAITGWGQEEDRRRAREAGFDRHLTKPADPDVIEEILASARLSGNGSPMTRRADPQP